MSRRTEWPDRGSALAEVVGSTWDCPLEISDDEAATPAAKNTKAPLQRKPVQGMPIQRTPGHGVPIQSTPVRNAAVSSPSSSARKRKAANEGYEASPSAEKRLCKFRSQPTQAFYNVYQRALSQRFYVLKRTPGGSDACPEEEFEMTGSTGNVYTVHIGEKSSCNCPHARKGNECKHVFYVLARVLQAPFDLVYQKALLPSELRAIFASAPGANASGDSGDGKRKPVEGECPICFCELDAKSPESVVWCRAACGQNIHQECFETWARTKSGDVTCPLCRSKWQGDAAMVSKVQMSRAVPSEGYANVAHQLGISTHRDERTYSEWYRYGGRRRWF